jgi:hypothetical protein
MPNTFTLIASNTVTSDSTVTVTFSSIPQTYTDLCIKLSARDDRPNAANDFWMYFNGSSTNRSTRVLYGTGSSASSFGESAKYIGIETGNTATASTFNNAEIYITNYAGSNIKSISADSVMENNATASEQWMVAALSPTTAAITSITFQYGPNNGGTGYKANSTFYLYGISNT